MDKEKQSIHYCTILSDEQWNFILEGRFSAQRQRCLHRLMTHAVRTKTVCNIKGIEIALEVGEVAASDVELAEYLKCNRKTPHFHTHPAFPYRLVCRWCPPDQSPLCQTIG